MSKRDPGTSIPRNISHTPTAFLLAQTAQSFLTPQSYTLAHIHSPQRISLNVKAGSATYRDPSQKRSPASVAWSPFWIEYRGHDRLLWGHRSLGRSWTMLRRVWWPCSISVLTSKTQRFLGRSLAGWVFRWSVNYKQSLHTVWSQACFMGYTVGPSNEEICWDMI